MRKDVPVWSASSKTSLNDVTNQLLLKYDGQFDKLYNTSDQLNQGITNKEELIVQNMQSEEIKDKTIQGLYYLFPFLITIAIIWILQAKEKLKFKLALLLTILLIIIYIIILYYYIIWEAKKNIAIQSANTGLNMKSWIESIFVETPSDYSCPDDCIQEISGEISGDESADGTVTPYSSVILDRQSSENVWLHGDRSLNLYNAKFKQPPYLRKGNYYTEEELKQIKPQPWFQGISPNGATYYECQYEGAFPKGSLKARNIYRDNGIPMIGKQNVFSTIPCHQMSGYQQKGKYICNTNYELKQLNRKRCRRVDEIPVEINLE
jgi:hypothetical protein